MKRLLCSALVLALVGSSPLWAQDKEKEDDAVAKALQKIADLGPGVHKVKFDKKGRIKTCIVVGSSRISTALGKGCGWHAAKLTEGIRGRMLRLGKAEDGLPAKMWTFRQTASSQARRPDDEHRGNKRFAQVHFCNGTGGTNGGFRSPGGSGGTVAA